MPPSVRRLVGTAPTAPRIVALLLLTALLIAFVSVWRAHSSYLGGTGGGLETAGVGAGWLPEPSGPPLSVWERGGWGRPREAAADGGTSPKEVGIGTRPGGREVGDPLPAVSATKRKENVLQNLSGPPPSVRGRGGGRRPKEAAADRGAPRKEVRIGTRPGEGGDDGPASVVPAVNVEEKARLTDRLYCMVPFLWTPSALHAYHAIHASWGRRCHILRFFIDPVIGDETVGFYNMTEGSDVIAAKKANLTLPGDVVILHGMRRAWHTCRSEGDGNRQKPVENCRNIFEKVWRMIAHVASHEEDVNGAEWFVKVDSDTFLFPDNVSRYVRARGWSYGDHHYFGHVLNHRRSDRGVSFVAGGAVFLSRATLLAAGDAFQNMPMDKGDEEEDGTCRDAYTGTEEVVTALCLKEHSNITAEPAVDPEGREQISLYEVDDILNYNRTDQGEWWFWEKKKRFPCHDDGDCLAHLPLAFHHYKDSEIFADLEKEFYGSIMKEEEDETLIKKGGGRVAARHWPNFDRVHRYFERIRTAMRGAQSQEQEGEPEPQRRKGSLTVPKTETKVEPPNIHPLASGRTVSSTKNALSTNARRVGKTTRRNDRVFCMVPFIWTPPALHAYSAIHASWGRRCHILRFFIDPVIGDETVGFYNMSQGPDVMAAKKANLPLPDDVVVLHDMRRPWHTCRSEIDEEANKSVANCRNIFEKVWRMVAHVARREEARGAEWFVKVDSDTFLFPENVPQYVSTRGWSHDDHHYFGHVLNHRMSDRGVSIVAGGAVFFSRATLLAAGDAFRNMPMDKGDEEDDGTCRDAYTGTEEVVTAVCLKEHSNITAEPAIDQEGREKISLYEVDEILNYNRTDQGEWWFWKGKKRFPCHDDGDCLAHLPLAFHHYKESDIFHDLEKEFHGSIMKGEKDKTLIKKRNGRVAARHWPNFDRTHRYFERVRMEMRERKQREKNK